jgi:hypothetical protein
LVGLVVIRYAVLCSVVNMTEKSLADKTSLPSSDSSRSRVEVVNENLTHKISPIKQDENNYIA